VQYYLLLRQSFFTVSLNNVTIILHSSLPPDRGRGADAPSHPPISRTSFSEFGRPIIATKLKKTEVRPRPNLGCHRDLSPCLNGLKVLSLDMAEF
jgi:hypothetical protein